MSTFSNDAEEDEVTLVDRLYRIRWPSGFVCPSCGGRRAWALQDRLPTYQCVRCDTQCSLTSGTIMHGTKLPLELWDRAARLVATSGSVLQARDLQEQLGLGSYTTALRLQRKLASALKKLGRRPRGPEELLVQTLRGTSAGAKPQRIDLSRFRRR